jgi:hypothetical protein
MIKLSPEQKDLILDFYFRCGSDQRIDDARDLIAENRAASELYASLEETLGRLDHVKYEPCPDNLVELTIARLKLAAAASDFHLDANPEVISNIKPDFKGNAAPITAMPSTSPKSFWSNLSNIVAAAAAVLIFASLAFPSLRQVRYIAACKSNMMKAGQGMERYANDNNGNYPTMASAIGTPWLNLGKQAKHSQPNTEHLYQLVKDDYVQSKHFICPGRKDAKVLTLTPAQMTNHADFPNRNNLSYSFTLRFGNNTSAPKVLLADRNPIFEDIAVKLQDGNFKMLSLNDSHMDASSLNHRSRGQVILFRDGGAKFSKTRMIDDDDIYTIKNQRCYKGSETPGSKDDIFLVP